MTMMLQAQWGRKSTHLKERPCPAEDMLERGQQASPEGSGHVDQEAQELPPDDVDQREAPQRLGRVCGVGQAHGLVPKTPQGQRPGLVSLLLLAPARRTCWAMLRQQQQARCDDHYQALGGVRIRLEALRAGCMQPGWA